METKRQVKIDLVTKCPDGSFSMVLVEEGPWETSEVENRLRQLQERLYGYVDIAVDGHLANLYPDSKGKRITIRLNCYDTPEESVKEFFERFANHVKQWDEVQREIKRLGFVNSLEFEYSRGTLGNEG